MALKPCSKCKILKDLSNFAKRSNRKSGYSSSCKKCNKLYQKEFYKKPGIKERIIENKRKLRKNPDFRKKEYAYSIKYQAKRRKEDSLFKLANNLRTRLGNFIRRNSINKKCGTLILLGCSLTKLKISFFKLSFSSINFIHLTTSITLTRLFNCLPAAKSFIVSF